jgi:hypothetical protein
MGLLPEQPALFLNKENHRLCLWFQKSYTFAEKEETSDVKL